MVMDQFVTTYRKDYLWPYVRTLGVRPYNEPKGQVIPCECHGLSDTMRYTDPMGQMLGPHAYEGESWSRLGPMGPLLDPKIYPAKISAAPESQISRYDQPNVFLAKLQEKYPFIYECLRTAPPDDILARINRDRLRTTYQVDYCKMNEYPSAPYEELLRAAGVDGLPLCQESVNLPGDSCPIYSRSRVSTYPRGGQPCGSIYKSKEAAYCVGSCKGPLATMTSGLTEYQDAISRLGQLIIRDKIHDPTVKRKEIPSGSPMEMIRTATNDVSAPCPPRVHTCGQPCKPIPRNKALRVSTITKQFLETSMPARGAGACQKKPKAITEWNPFVENCSEKQEISTRLDVIDTWGKMIYRQSPRRHHRLQ